MTRKKAIICIFGMCAMGAILAHAASTGQGQKILEFQTMVGVPRPYNLAANAIRGVLGAGLPWVVDQAHGELKTNGDLKIQVHGLVLDPNDAGVPPALRGTNPITLFKAIVSCQSVDGMGNPVIVNVSTGTFPADADGNARIDDTVVLPDPCLAPIVFVTTATNRWLATTGF